MHPIHLSVYIYMSKIYNLFVRDLETDRIASL